MTSAPPHPLTSLRAPCWVVPSLLLSSFPFVRFLHFTVSLFFLLPAFRFYLSSPFGSPLLHRDLLWLCMFLTHYCVCICMLRGWRPYLTDPLWPRGDRRCPCVHSEMHYSYRSVRFGRDSEDRAFQADLLITRLKTTSSRAFQCVLHRTR